MGRRREAAAELRVPEEPGHRRRQLGLALGGEVVLAGEAPSTPCTPRRLETTGRPAQKASRILFLIPEPEKEGRTATAARFSSAAISGTSAASSTPW